VKAEKTYRTGEWAGDSKAPPAIHKLMEKHGISVIFAGGEYPNMPPDLENALANDLEPAKPAAPKKKKGGK
jgi:hypothetical protein